MQKNGTSPATDTDTIAAIATPPGRGGIGVIRLSGPQAVNIAEQMTRQVLRPRFAHYGAFYQVTVQETQESRADSTAPTVLDRGIALYFPAPHSFTGEDVVELQAHGGPVLLDCLLREMTALGARLARPGEFSERAFLNDKIDLTQAEAIADLIDSSSEQAARQAMRSLDGEFSRRVHQLVQSLIELRVYVEAAIDFPEEEIDFLADGKVQEQLQNLLAQLQQLLAEARQGALLREGMTVVIAGKPNAGKSSLLNALAARDSAIVTDIAGTTRDILREQIQIDGMPLHIIDTAGLRESDDPIEQEGIRRAWQEIEKADRILLVVDSNLCRDTDPERLWPALHSHHPQRERITVIHNKCDLAGLEPALQSGDPTVIRLAAKSGVGISLLREHLKSSIGFSSSGEGGFTARRRHLDALNQAKQLLDTGLSQLTCQGAGELLAEDLRQTQQVLATITGEFRSDDLLGEIFSSFCIGK